MYEKYLKSDQNEKTDYYKKVKISGPMQFSVFVTMAKIIELLNLKLMDLKDRHLLEIGKP